MLLLKRAHLRAEIAAGVKPGTFGFLMQVGNHYATRSLKLALYTIALVAAVVRRMLKSRVALGNISRVLLNLIKSLIFVMFKDLNFVSLPYLFG